MGNNNVPKGNMAAIRSALVACAITAGLLAAGAVQAQTTQADPDGNGLWFSLGLGHTWIGDPDNTAGDQSDGGTTAYTAVTFASDAVLRLRGLGFSYTSNTAVEQAVLVGARFGKDQDWMALVGYSKLDDVSETEDNTNGLALELLYAPRGRGAFGFEAGLFGNFNDDHDFGGLLFGMRFGDLD